MRYANQIKIFKAQDQDDDLTKGWKVITKAELEEVGKRLHNTTAATVLMWLDLAINSSRYTPCLSGIDYKKRLGITHNPKNGNGEYANAKKNLMKAGYLVPKKDGQKNDYIFYRQSIFDQQPIDEFLSQFTIKSDGIVR